MTPFRSQRSARFEYASEAVNHIESRNCAQGCRRGATDEHEARVYGPGGTCKILLDVLIAGPYPIPELDDNGVAVTCLAREPL